MEMTEEEKCQNPPKNKTNELKDEEEEDRISLLPDCLLVDILSRLPSTKYAIRTGTLSKRWQHLWPYVHNLIFLETDYYLDLELSERNDQRLFDFVVFVYTTLAQCRQFNLTEFRLYVSYDMQYESHLNNWIRYAFSCNVQDLYLTIVNKDSETEFVLGQFFFVNSSFTRLSLDGCTLYPAGAISWTNVKSLYISKMGLDDDLIENILSGSPVLETLELAECYGYQRIDITSKSVKEFVLYGYDPPEELGGDLDDIVEINAPYIASLTIGGDLWLWKLLLLDVSSLVKAYLNYDKLGHDETTRREGKEEMLKAFIQSLRHVKELKIGTSCVNTLSRLEAKGFIFPSNLKVVDYVSLIPSDSDSDSDRDSNESGDSDGDSEELLLDDDLEREGGEAD